MKYVIIGAGAAGVAAAKAIKTIDKHGDVIVMGEESFFPYNRFMLTDFLCDSITENELIYTSPGFFKELGITFRKGEYVKAIHPEEKTVKLFHNEVVNYDKLLIATGGTPTLGPVLQPFRKLIQRYYTLEDILVLKRKLPGIKKCIVFGDGLSSLDLIRGLRNLGKDVTYITRGERADWGLVDPELSVELHRFLESRGVEIITEDRLISIEQRGGMYHTLTLKRHKLTADIVFAWDRYLSNINVIKGTRIEKKSGILVNDRLKTSEEDIYAAGDCVEIYHPELKDYWINFGWINARDQGTAAGKNMAGEDALYKIHEVVVFNLMGQSLKARWWK
jgi:NAD(P)H-nitrite reductase large subunit